ncbi:MAG: DUF6152 family protein [Rhodospirillaceae bacterium]|nr:DUF6152 family protein [Rhodospirillaceae bacterium]
MAGQSGFGSMKSVTTRLRPGYLRKNGVPYSDSTEFTEYWDVHVQDNGDQYLVVTNKVEDPVYLEDQEVTVEGRLVQFLWRNPHTLVHIMVEQDDGTNVRYVVEWGSATQLGATGVSRESLRPGDYVVINGNPGRNAEDNRVRLLNFLRPSDGLTWGLRPGEVFD